MASALSSRMSLPPRWSAGVAAKSDCTWEITVCADPGEARGSDIELEFFLDEIAPGLSVSAPLSRFLSVWLPTVLHGDERAVVLALCNPHRADVPKPAALEGAGVPMYYALGEVESWYDGGVTLRAEAWRVAR